MKLKLFWTGLLLIVIVLLLFRIFSGGTRKAANTSPVAKTVVPVEVFIARDTNLVYQLQTIGSLRSSESVDIVSEISKKVVKIYLREGSYVNKGDLLFKLDDAEISSRLTRLSIDEKLAALNEGREKAQLQKGGISQEHYDDTRSRLDIIRAEMDILKVEMDKTEIRAPFAGRIGLRNVSEGALVNPQMVLADLQDISSIKIDFSVPERYVADLKQGAGISFTTDYSNRVYRGVIEAVEPDISGSTRTIPVRAVCPNPDGSLVPGATARVLLDLRALVKKLFIPSAALIPSMKGYNVYLMKSGKARLTPVVTGIRTRTYVEVSEGILKGDTLVVTNLLRVKPDSPLKLVKLD
jgi:membrane fusion protein (multidrug efflux system)